MSAAALSPFPCPTAVPATRAQAPPGARPNGAPDAPADDRDPPASAAAGTSDEAAAALSSAQQYVSFEAGDTLFAVAIAPVQEIIRLPVLCPLPRAPAALQGLANLRGRVLPVVGLRQLLGQPPAAPQDATRVLVIDLGQGQPLGLVVDRVARVITAAPADIEPADAVQSAVQADFLRGVIKQPRGDGSGQDLLLLVDVAGLIAAQFAQLGGLGAQAMLAAGGPGPGQAVADDAGSHLQQDSAGPPLHLVSFMVDGQELALDIALVQEVVARPAQLNPMPQVPAHVLGLMLLRQRPLPVLSLRALFALAESPWQERQRVVVLALPGGQRVGLAVDAVNAVMSVPAQLVDPVPSQLTRPGRQQGITALCRLDEGRRLVSLLSPQRLLGAPAVAQVLTGTPAPAELEADADAGQPADDTVAGQGADDGAQVVIFRLAAEEYGLPIMCVQEVLRVPEALARVPRTPDCVAGVINLRGTVVPVIDQRARLNLPPQAHHERQRIVVVLLAGQRTGFIVDSVADVPRIPAQQIDRTPAVASDGSGLIRRIARLDNDRRLVLLIEPGQLLAGLAPAAAA